MEKTKQNKKAIHLSTSKLVEMATPGAALSKKTRKNTHRALGAGEQGRPQLSQGEGEGWGKPGEQSFQVPSSALKLGARAWGLDGS